MNINKKILICLSIMHIASIGASSFLMRSLQKARHYITQQTAAEMLSAKHALEVSASGHTKQSAFLPTASTPEKNHSSLMAALLKNKNGQNNGWQGKHEQQYQHDNADAFWSKNKTRCTLGFTIFGFTLWGYDPEYEDADQMQNVWQQADDATKANIIHKISSDLTSFAQRWNRYLVVATLLKNSPDAAKAFTQPAADNLATLADTYEGTKIIETLIQLNPDAAKAFMQPALDNFATLATTEDGCKIIESLIKNSPDTAKAFTQPALDNFATLATTRYGALIILILIKVNPDAAKAFMQPALDNFATLVNTLPGALIITTLIQLNPDAAKAFMQLAADNFATLVNTGLGTLIIDKLIQLNPDAARAFMQLAADNFATLVNTDLGTLIIDRLIKKNPDAARAFTQPALDNFATLVNTDWGTLIVDRLIQFNPDATELIEKYHKATPPAPLFLKQSTQSTQHFKTLIGHNTKKLKTFIPKQDEPLFNDMIEKVLQLEHDHQEQGRYTFVHGYPWHYHFLHDLYSALRQSSDGKQYDDYMFLRFITNPHEASGQKHEQKRIDLLNNGVRRYYAKNTAGQKHMLFMNYALLCNQSGSNTLQYIARNRCENPTTLPIETIFKHLNIDIKPYEEDLKKIEALHRDANAYGAGLLLSFTPEMLAKSVYVCHGGGYKKTLAIDQSGKTDNVAHIIDTLRENPARIRKIDTVEFVHILTKDCALNPEVIASGAVKIIPFSPADPEKLARYEQARDELVARIKADLASKRSALTGAEIETWQDDLRYFDAINKKYNCLNEPCGSRLQE